MRRRARRRQRRRTRPAAGRGERSARPHARASGAVSSPVSMQAASVRHGSSDATRMGVPFHMPAILTRRRKNAGTIAARSFHSRKGRTREPSVVRARQRIRPHRQASRRDQPGQQRAGAEGAERRGAGRHRRSRPRARQAARRAGRARHLRRRRQGVRRAEDAASTSASWRSSRCAPPRSISPRPTC